MSESSKIDSSNHGCDSDGELSEPSTYGSEVQESPAQHESQDCKKRPRQQQIQGTSWALCAQITVDELHAGSAWLMADSEGDVQNEERTAKINAHIKSLFGDQFQILFGKLRETVSYFVLFCNLINILDIGTGSNDAAEIKIEIKGFLQLQNSRAATRLQDLLKPFAPALSGYWERCVGGLFGHAGYTECLRPESAWFKLHDTGAYGNNNKGKLQAKARRLADPVFLERGTFAILTKSDQCMRCCFIIHKTDPPSPQSAVKSPAGSSSSRASSSSAAARSTSVTSRRVGRAERALVSLARLSPLRGSPS